VELVLHNVGGEDSESVLVFSTGVFLVVGLLELGEFSSVFIDNVLHSGLAVEEDGRCDQSGSGN